MIKARIQPGDKTQEPVEIELPQYRYDLYVMLRENGIDIAPDSLRLNPNGTDAPTITLTGESELDRHLIALSGDNSTLGEINRAVDLVRNASEHILPQLYDRIVSDDFDSFADLEDGIEEMTWSAGELTVSFYYPLVGQLDERDEDYGSDTEPVGSRYLAYYEDEIRAALEREQKIDTCNIVSYLDCGEQLRDKLIAMRWDVEAIGHELYGRTDVRIAEELTPEESAAVTQFILGQNADGLGEGYEQKPIKIDDGDLYVSMWNSGNDYFVCGEDELYDHINQSAGQGFGDIN